jgi:hypothetical protein
MEDVTTALTPEERYIQQEIRLKDNGILTPNQITEHYLEWTRKNHIIIRGVPGRKLSYLIRQKLKVEAKTIRIEGQPTRAFHGIGFVNTIY